MVKSGLAISVALEVVCSLLPVTVTAGNQLENVENIDEMLVAAGWLARGSRTQVLCFRGEDIMDTLVGTVDPSGWRWLLVAVRDEQAEAMLREQWHHRLNQAAPAIVCTCRSLESATEEIASVMDCGTQL